MNRLFLSVVFTILVPWVTHAATLTYISDLVTASAPNATSSHAIQFTATHAIPASGSVVIAFPSSFVFSGSFDIEDVDLLQATSSGYVNRPIAAVADVVNDGVTIDGSARAVTLQLNGSDGIAAGDRIRVVLGDTANYQLAGAHTITNPPSVGSYRVMITTQDVSDATIDSAATMDSIIAPVGITADIIPTYPIRFNGLPSGLIPANNNVIELSLNTNRYATCRYATTTGVDYDSMTHQFSPTISTSFYTVVTGHQNDTTYHYYVRCSDTNNIKNIDDYEITFKLLPTPDSTSSIRGQAGADGSGGAGAIPYGSPTLYQASVAISGWSSPNSTLVFLKDGKQAGTTVAKRDGSFTYTITNLERGIYTFGVYAVNAAGQKSGSYTSTLTLGQGTRNTIDSVIVPPIMTIQKNPLDVGESAQVSGESIVGSIVELEVSPQESSDPSLVQTYTASTTQSFPDAAAVWRLTVPSSVLTRGSYRFRARTIPVSGTIRSPYSTLFVGVGAAAHGDSGLRVDLNHDGKVNLIDFSIMLSTWGKGGVEADVNDDGTVNLADVSILLFNWTG